MMNRVSPTTYSAMLGAPNPFVEGGRRYAIRTRSLASLTPDAISEIVAAGDTRTSPLSMISVHHLHDAATRVAADATAFGLRREHLVVEIIAAWEPGDGGHHRAWADDVAVSLAPHALPGGYPNLLGPDNHEQTARAYGENAPRLLAAEAHFDPDGVFAATPLPTAEGPRGSARPGS